MVEADKEEAFGDKLTSQLAYGVSAATFATLIQLFSSITALTDQNQKTAGLIGIWLACLGCPTLLAYGFMHSGFLPNLGSVVQRTRFWFSILIAICGVGIGLQFFAFSKVAGLLFFASIVGGFVYSMRHLYILRQALKQQPVKKEDPS